MAGRGNSSAVIARAEVVRAARAYAYDDYLAAMMVPAGPLREDLVTLAAYLGDIARIPLLVSEPGLGEIRLQWWRDALSQEGPIGHPVAEAISELIRRRALSVDLVLAPLDARAAELYAEPFADRAGLDAYLAASEGAHLALRGQILRDKEAAPGGADGSDGILGAAETILGLTRLCVRLPALLSKGRVLLDAQRLQAAAPAGSGEGEEALRTAVKALIAEAAQHYGQGAHVFQGTKARTRLIVLPVALARPYLRVLQGVEHDPIRSLAELSPLHRLSCLWLAARFGRF